MPSERLRQMQSQFQAVVVGEKSSVDGVKGPQRLTAEEGLKIYQRMYRLRMRDALLDDFGACATVLDDEFRILCLDYVTHHPSQSYTLGHLGRNFPEFVSQWGSERGKPPWLGELACFEHSLAEAYLAPAAQVLDQEWLRSLRPEALVSARLRASPSVQKLAFNWNIIALYESYQADEPWSEPSEMDTFVVTYGNAQRVSYEALDDQGHAMFQLLFAGHSIEEAVGVMELSEAQAPRVFQWLSRWIALGLFDEVEVQAT
ncbi:MAG: putative DNA-binding domain-containing protein [Myxococcales bacterium]|nr:putative DNA-binding domain-containing protein [Myxococcales bacterium]